MFGRKARRIEKLSINLIQAQTELWVLQGRFNLLEKLVNVGTIRLDIHARRLGALEDDVENLK